MNPHVPSDIFTCKNKRIISYWLYPVQSHALIRLTKLISVFLHFLGNFGKWSSVFGSIANSSTHVVNRTCVHFLSVIIEWKRIANHVLFND